MDSPAPAKDEDDGAACHALQLRALDACVVSEMPTECARVLELYRARGCGTHERFVDFLPPPAP